MVAVADIIVKSPDDKTQLVVETKTKIPASADWAARMRKNLYAYVALPQAPFFLLALPEKFYLWKNAEPSALEEPHFEIDAQQALQPLLNGLTDSLTQLSESSFQLLVRTWLEGLIISTRIPTNQPESLTTSGLYDAIKNGSIVNSQET